MKQTQIIIVFVPFVGLAEFMAIIDEQFYNKTLILALMVKWFLILIDLFTRFDRKFRANRLPQTLFFKQFFATKKTPMKVGCKFSILETQTWKAWNNGQKIHGECNRNKWKKQQQNVHCLVAL